ncbi:DUF1120 domain-containing protein [Pseudomonas sp. LS1212]|uniref:DUF1120 domain-containing protein n=1 Tax=Pseudomonas sp. LS1212 TaxID=2972478 RepID=UPI00215BA430|nr:DUF1120 domain-containing protein [Pseudomonas sp. LS1212]UVJ45133.1 DUF1120 domain-containing protein [Pseudomonas sp. LS1212]
MRSACAFIFFASLSVVGGALAQSATDLTVTGTITPAACAPMLSGGGEFNFGMIAAQDLDQEAITNFISPARQLSVACSAPTRFALRAVDGRAGTQPTVTIDNFGLGLSGVERIGEYKLRTTGYAADGSAAIDVLESRDAGSSWLKAPSDESYLFNTNGPNLTAVGGIGANEPSAIEVLTTDLAVSMAITAAKNLTLTDEVTIDGAATLEVVYL